MAHFVEIDASNIVIRGVVLDDKDTQDESGDEVESVGAKYLSDGFGGTWKRTSYNTNGGVHSLGGTPLRRNYATVGGTYDSETDEFIPEKPTPSCVLVRTDGGDWWMPPKPYPFEIVGGKFEWKEDIQEWVDVG